MPRPRDARICPYCGKEVRLSRAPIVATDFTVESQPAGLTHTPGIELYDDPAAAAGDEEIDADDPGADLDAEHIGRETQPGQKRPTSVVGGHRALWWPPDEGEDASSWISRILGGDGSDLESLAAFPVERLARRVCPSCETAWPPDLDTRQAHILAVVGLNGAGKTNYLAAALTQATRSQGLEPFGVTEFAAADDETAKRLHHYTTSLYRHGKVLDRTLPDAETARIPLTFRVAVRGREPILMMTHDISGEILMDYKQRARVTPFLSRASAVIFLVDPVEFDVIRDRLPIEALIEDGRYIHQADLLRSCLEQLRYHHDGRPVPVAVTVSKADLIVDLVEGITLADGPPYAADWISGVKDTNDAVHDMLIKLNERDLVCAADAHEQVTYHAVSALGAMPSAMEQPRPLRCLEPLATVLVRLAGAI